MATSAPILLLAPDIDHPVVAGAEVDPARCRWATTVDVIVTAQILRGWHIYPLGASAGMGIPTALHSKAPPGTQWAGEWRVANEPGEQELTGSVKFVRPLQAMPGWRGVVIIPIDFTYEACDAFSCRPPVTESMYARLEIVP